MEIVLDWPSTSHVTKPRARGYYLGSQIPRHDINISCHDINMDSGATFLGSVLVLVPKCDS